MIERHTGIPLYYQIQEYLRGQIESAEWHPGDQIPTEQQLCDRFGVSRITVVKAITRLVEEGLLVREQGKGTFVSSPPLTTAPLSLLSFTEEMGKRGLKAGSRILSLNRRPCPPTLLESLQLKADDLVWVIERLRTAGDLPMGLQRAYLSFLRFPQLDTLLHDDASLYDVLARAYHVYPEKAVETYSAVELSATEAELLQRESTRPAFAVERLTRDTQGTVMEYVRSVMRNDKYHYIVELVRTK